MSQFCLVQTILWAYIAASQKKIIIGILLKVFYKYSFNFLCLQMLKLETFHYMNYIPICAA